MAGQYQSITDGAILVAVIIGWVALIDRLTYFMPWLGRLLEADKVCLVRDGQLIRRSMRREYLTPAELMSELRQNGVEDLSEIPRDYIEPDGNISVLKRRGAPRRVPNSGGPQLRAWRDGRRRSKRERKR